MTTGALLLYGAASVLSKTSQSAGVTPAIIGAAAGLFLLVGLWTPLAGTLIAIIETWNLLAHSVTPLLCLTAAILGATLAMIGPGTWYVDARLFGRKHIDTP